MEAEGWGASGVEGLVWQEAQRLTAFGRSTANEGEGWRLIVHGRLRVCGG